jgi:transcriptional regulator with XRE-family HTH domain
MTVNDRIKQVRDSLKLSQRNFSQGIHLSNGYYANMEIGNKKANDRIIELVSSVYGVSKNWLVSGEGAMFSREPDKRLEEMTVLFNGLNRHFQDYVLTQIKGLIKLQNMKDPDNA